MLADYLKKAVKPCDRDPRVLLDSDLKGKDYVDSFGFEWTQIDGFVKRIYTDIFWSVHDSENFFR